MIDYIRSHNYHPSTEAYPDVGAITEKSNEILMRIKIRRQILLNASYAESLRRSCRTLFNNKSITGFSIKRNIAQLENSNII